MSILSTIKSFLGFRTAAESEISLNPEHFIYVKVPGNIGPLDRGSLYEDPIEDALRNSDVGTVSGGGSSLGTALPDGSRQVEFCGIDIDTEHPAAALERLRVLLPQISAPLGTELHYTRSGRMLQDCLTNSGWQLGQPRTFTHPGFGV